MTPDQKRRLFQRIKAMSQDNFYFYMNQLHTDAYMLAEKHYQEAMFIELPPRQVKAVEARVKTIREAWDGIITREV